jgi:hypothetical protein
MLTGRRSFLVHFAFAAICLVASAVQAAPPLEFKLEGAQMVRGSSESTREAYFNIKWEADLKMGLLLGEPVISVRLRYDITSGLIALPYLGTKGVTYQTLYYEKLPQELQSKIRLTDIKLNVAFIASPVTGTPIVHIVEDVGATGPPGEWSFNVPGSPDWDDLFLLPSPAGAYLGESAAITVWKEGLSLYTAHLESLDVNLYDLHEAYMKDYGDREEYRALEAANNRLIEGIRRSYGFDASANPAAWTRAHTGDLDSGEEWAERHEKLSAFLEKLSNPPDTLRQGTNHTAYDQAVEDAHLLRRSISYAARNYRPEEVSPSSLEQGYEAEFDQEAPEETNGIIIPLRLHVVG